MSPAEITARLKAIAATFGKKAEAYITISADRTSAALYPAGLGSSSSNAVHAQIGKNAASLADLLDALEAATTAHIDRYRIETVEAMALAIIELTAQGGQCSAAGLRMRFDAAAVVEFGAAAVARADEMAANGPFSIIEAASNHQQAA